MRRSIMNECPEFGSANGKLSVDFWVRAAVRVSVRHRDRFLFLRGAVADSGITLLGNGNGENQHVST